MSDITFGDIVNPSSPRNPFNMLMTQGYTRQPGQQRRHFRLGQPSQQPAGKPSPQEQPAAPVQPAPQQQPTASAQPVQTVQSAQQEQPVAQQEQPAPVQPAPQEHPTVQQPAPQQQPATPVQPSTWGEAITLGGNFFDGTQLYYNGYGRDAAYSDPAQQPVEASFETNPTEGTADPTPETITSSAPVTLGEYIEQTRPLQGRSPLREYWFPGDGVTAAGAERILGGRYKGGQGGGDKGGQGGGDEGDGDKNTSFFTEDAIAPAGIALGVGGLAGALMGSNPVATAAGTGIGALGGHLLWKYLSENKNTQAWINENLWDGAGEHMQYIAPAIGGLAGLFLAK